MKRKVHIHLTGDMGCGKSTIATIIREALDSYGIPNKINRSVANRPTRSIKDMPHDEVEVSISEQEA